MESVPSKRNIEIKAQISTPEEFESKIELCKSLTHTNGEVIKQRDVFFNSSATHSSRLKLRYLEAPKKSQLLYYERPNVSGPKLSNYDLLEIDDPKALEKILTQANGVQGYVNKTRLLFLYGQTRIHLDRVENLGTYLEFEVCLRPEQTLAEGEKIASDLMKLFELEESSLLTSAYLDEIIK